MKKSNVVAFDKDWHLKLGTKSTEKGYGTMLKKIERSKNIEIASVSRIKSPVVNGWSDPGESLMTVEQVAKHLKVEPCSIYRWVRQGELVAERLGINGKIIRISKSELNAYKTRTYLKHG